MKLHSQTSTVALFAFGNGNEKMREKQLFEMPAHLPVAMEWI